MTEGLVLALLVALSGLHVYWGLGGVWPGHDPRSLACLVVGGAEDGRLPTPLACFGVAVALLLAAAALHFAAAGGAFGGLARVAAFGVAGVFLLRGALGYVLPALTHTGKAFDRLNRLIYSPLCLVLGGLALALLLG
ncbi:DUF3995 domain-containing protein [Deinococcus phoenicis]|uniref:DUF3995 domain-containing protein n=1 Tax=Deinococcus phoenicis TaxID=1476583 RepID=UPI001267D659|nr:DUF3995 domain-containing protein [Deinococcus phoenicis]